MIKIISKTLLVMLIILICSTGIIAISNNLNTTTSEVYIPSENSDEVILLQGATLTYDNSLKTKEELLQAISNMEARKEAAHLVALNARQLWYPEDHPVIRLATEEWKNAETYRASYQTKYDLIIQKENEKKQEKYNEYPAATTIWYYLKDLGYNDYVCAGIMGNLMTEVGGQTLNIQYDSYGNGYYGMCQWNRAYQSKIWGAGLSAQCDFLRDTIKYEFDTYGYNYSKGFNHEAFLQMTDERAAALAFAKCYERCGSGSYGIRQKNATIAYKYFTK